MNPTNKKTKNSVDKILNRFPTTSQITQLATIGTNYVLSSGFGEDKPFLSEKGVTAIIAAYEKIKAERLHNTFRKLKRHKVKPKMKFEVIAKKLKTKKRKQNLCSNNSTTK